MKNSSHFATVLSLFILNLIFNTSALAQEQCSRVFEETPAGSESRLFKTAVPADSKSPLIELQQEFNETKNTGLSWGEMQQARKILNKKIENFLDDLGIKTRFYEYDYTGFIILPEGTTYFAKIAKGLARYGLQLQYSPRALASGGLAMYNSGKKTIFIDVASLSQGKLSPVALHEIRHAIDDIRSKKKENNFERNFQSSIQIRNGKGLPGAPEEFAYKNYFSLDEILAHRQSMANFLSYFEQHKSDNSDMSETLHIIKVHASRIIDFAQTWQATSKIIESEILQNAFDAKAESFDRAPPPYHQIRLSVIAPTWLQKTFFRKNVQDPQMVGLEMSLTVSAKEAELIEKKPRSEGKALVLAHLKDIDTIIQNLEGPLAEMQAALNNFDGKNPFEFKKALEKVNAVLVSLKSKLNNP